MAEISIHDVQEVRELEGGPDRVNGYLNDGWILLHIYSNTVPSDNGPAQVPVYVLGRLSLDAGAYR